MSADRFTPPDPSLLRELAIDRDSPERVGERLRRLRQERGLSQRGLAERAVALAAELGEVARVSYAYISRVEAGTRRPSVYALRALARALGVTAEELEFGHAVSPEMRAAARKIARLERRLAGAERRARRSENELRALRRAIGVERVPGVASAQVVLDR